jgi:hypothetical protein
MKCIYVFLLVLALVAFASASFARRPLSEEVEEEEYCLNKNCYTPAPPAPPPPPPPPACPAGEAAILGKAYVASNKTYRDAWFCVKGKFTTFV